MKPIEIKWSIFMTEQKKKEQAKNKEQAKKKGENND